MAAKVLIADNHPIFRAGLRQVIEDVPGHMVVGEASDGEAAIAQAQMLKPDIVVVDLNMPVHDGFEVIAWLVANQPRCRVLVVSMHADRAFVRRAAELGGHGFIAKEDAASELEQALLRPGDGFYMSSATGHHERALVETATPDPRLSEILDSLTRTERRVLRLVADSRSSRDIAEALGIAERTVHTHRNNICGKLGVHGPNGLLHFALANRATIEAMPS